MLDRGELPFSRQDAYSPVREGELTERARQLQISSVEGGLP